MDLLGWGGGADLVLLLYSENIKVMRTKFEIYRTENTPSKIAAHRRAVILTLYRLVLEATTLLKLFSFLPKMEKGASFLS